MRIIARILSTVLHPLLMPTYGMLLLSHYSWFFIYPGGDRFALILAGLTALFTFAMPVIGIGVLKACGLISSVTLNVREERGLPYVMAIACYCVLGVLLHRMNVPSPIIALIAGSVASLIICIVITRWWKISAHMTGMGGFLGCMVYLAYAYPMLSLPVLSGMILLAGMLASSRIILGRHTFAQTIAGFANGFVCVSAAMVLANLI